MSPWFDFWPKFALAALNALALGGVALGVGYWFNRRLEKHKRNEAITAELAKQCLAAYLRVLTTVGEINGLLFFAEIAADRDGPPAKSKSPPPEQHPLGDADKALGAAFRECFKSAPLVNDTFAVAAVGFLGFASRHMDECHGASEPAREKLKQQRMALLSAVGLALPAFVKLPSEDAFHYTRSFEEVFVDVGIWGRDEVGQVRIAE